MSLSMNDVLQYLASSGAEEEAEKQFGLSSQTTIGQDLQIRSIRETLAEKQKAKHDEFVQKLVRQANLVNVDVLEQERQLAELEALERQLRDEQLTFEAEKRAIAQKVQQLDKQQTQSLIETQKEELLFLQKKKQKLEQSAREKEQAVKEMTEKLEQEERNRVKEQEERDRKFKERIQPHKPNLFNDSRNAVVSAAEKIAQARAEAKAIQDELDAVTQQAQHLKDPSYFTHPHHATQEQAHPSSDPDLDRVENTISEMKNKWKENAPRRKQSHSTTTKIIGLQADDSLQQFVDRWLEGEASASIDLPAFDDKHELETSGPSQHANNATNSARSSSSAPQHQHERPDNSRRPDEHDALVELVKSLKQELSELKSQQQHSLPANKQESPAGPPPQTHAFPNNAATQQHVPPFNSNHTAPPFPTNQFGMPPHPQMWQWPQGLNHGMQFPPAPYPFPQPIAPVQQPTDQHPQPTTPSTDNQRNDNRSSSSQQQQRDSTGSPEQRWRKSAPTQALLRLEQQHREQMTKMEFEMEKLDRQQQLQELRQRLDRDQHARQQEEEHQKWLLEQKRQLQTLRVQQALQREKQILERTMQQSDLQSPLNTSPVAALEEKWNAAGVFRPSMPWEPSQGIATFVDGVSFSNTASLGVVKLRVSAGILQAPAGESQVTYLARISGSSWMDTADGVGKRDQYWCTASLCKETNKAIAGQRVLLVVEVQGMMNPEQESQRTAVAWAYVTPIVNNKLRTGVWKAKLLSGGVNQVTFAASKSAAPDPPAGTELGFVYFRLLDLSEVARAAQFIPTTSADESMYLDFVEGENPFEVPEPSRATKQDISPAKREPPAAHPVQSPVASRPSSRPASSQYSFRMESRQHTQMQSRAAQRALQRPSSSQFFEDASGGARPERAETEHWLPGRINSGRGSVYEKGDAMDIYVDCARFLPDSCSATRVVVRALTSDAEMVSQVSECFSPFTSSVVSPSFNFRVELREHAFNMTTTLMLRIDTLEVTNLQPVCVGYAALKLFVDADNAQPSESGAQGCYINEGNYQLPLTAMRPSLVDFCENSVQRLARIPCASLLVRISCAPKSADGLSVLSRAEIPERQWRSVGLDKPAPKYSDGQYDGNLCTPSPEEVLAYAAKATSEGFATTVESRTRQRLAELQGPDALSMPAKALEEAILSRFPLYDDMREVMSTGFIAPYNQQAGLRVSVDALYKLPDSGMLSKGFLTKVIYSLTPPGLYYRQPPLTEGVQFTRSIDPDHPWRAPVFRDGFHTFSQLALSDGSCVVFDVRHIKYDRKAIHVEQPDRKRGYWGLFPIMTSLFGRQDTLYEKRYVASGLYQIPLVEGVAQQDIIQHDRPWEELLRRLALRRSADGALKLAEGVSLLVKVVDTQVSALYQAHYIDTAPGEVDKTILREMIDAANQSSSVRPERYMLDLGNAGKPVSSVLGKDEESKKSMKEVNKAFAEATSINHYVF